MITLDTRLKRVDFKIIDSDGVERELYLTQFTAADGLRMHELQVKRGDKLTFADLSISRLTSSVRNSDGSYFWDINSIDEFKTDLYPDTMLAELNKMINELNPFNTDIKAKKKSS